jgi:GH35 family endo-1,4-beta-xylanase
LSYGRKLKIRKSEILHLIFIYPGFFNLCEMKKFLRKSVFVLVALLPAFISNGQNSLPSCVITTPHCNAYFKQGSDIMIRVYATDLGGTYTGGSVTNVEFFNNDEKLGETTDASSNTYSFLWTKVPAGNYRITARSTDNNNAVSTSAGVIITVGSSEVKPVGLSAGKGKYLANVIPNNVRSDFNNYWNGVTAENSCKWGSVEGTRDVMSWVNADRAYNHAKNNNLSFRYHALAWGSQYPSWIKTLSPADFQAEMEEYMAAVAARYPLIDQIDVLNENMYINTWNKQEHAAGTPYFRTGLGGPGATGYDWAIWLFEKARYYFPNAKLVMNDFELETNTAGVNEMLNVVKVLRDRNLIDGFGTQAHYFNVDGISTTNLQNALNLMAKSGVPIYVTELDLKGKTATEASQLQSYSGSFPVYWNHPAVAGITLWGYVEGATWEGGTGILNSNGTERSAMTWLKSYMAEKPDVGYPFSGGDSVAENNLLANGEFDSGTDSWAINSYNSGNGSMTVVTDANMSGNNALKICPTTPGAANWEIQVSQNAPFVAGKNYTISFMAKAALPRTITVAMQKAGSPYTTYFEGLATLTTSNQFFTFPFKPALTDATNKLKFYVGTDANCLTIDSVVFKEEVNTGIEQNKENQFISVYPNPVTHGKVTVENKAEQIKTIEVIDFQGKLVKTVKPVTFITEIEVSDLPKGMYFIKVHSEKSIGNRKIVIL